MDSPRILVADDDRGIIAALRARLESLGFEVIAAQDAYQALSLAVDQLPDMMILDVNMPAGTGFSVEDRMANRAGLKGVPILYITGEDAGRVEAFAAANGTHVDEVRVLQKPFDTDELIALVYEALEVPREAA